MLEASQGCLRENIDKNLHPSVLDAWRNVDTSKSGAIELSKFMTPFAELGFVEMNVLALLKASGACHVRYEEFFHNLFDGFVDCLQPENAGSGTQSEPGPSVQKCVAQDDDCEGDAGLAAVPAGIDDAAHAAAAEFEKQTKEQTVQQPAQQAIEKENAEPMWNVGEWLRSLNYEEAVRELLEKAAKDSGMSPP